VADPSGLGALPDSGPMPGAGQVYFVSSDAARELLRWDEVIDCVAKAYRERQSEAATPARSVARFGGSWLRTLPAIPVVGRYFGAKLMGGSFGRASRPGVQYVIVLFDHLTSRIAAFVDGELVTAFRTAATSAVALNALAREAPIRLGVLGSGLEAGTHVRAFATVRPIEAISVFSPTAARRKAFAASVEKELGIPVDAVDAAEAAVSGATVVLAAARSRGERPIVYGDWLSPGTVVVSIGSTVPEQREIDVSVVAKSDLIVCDVVDEVLHQTGDMIEAARAGISVAGKTVALHAVLCGEAAQSLADAKLPLFKSVGSGLQDIVVAEHLLNKALEAGLATALPAEFSIKA
jgi:alanine dehydrogenase